MRARAVLASALMLLVTGCGATGEGTATAATPTADSSPTVGPAEASPTAVAASDESRDSDGDGLPDTKEAELGTDPQNPDTDGDGLDDLYELIHSLTDPLLAATYDGVPDPQVDLDEDGLTLTEELDLGTDPLTGDTDGDGIDDGEEAAASTDPLDAYSPGPVMIDGAVVMHDGGETEVTVTAEGSDDSLAQLNVFLSEDGQWAETPARLGPVVSAIGGTEPVTLRLRYPETIAGGLAAEELIVAVDDYRSGTIDFLVLEHDAKAGVFTAELTVAPDAAPDLVLLDLEAYKVLFR
ncbi:hypothetical protein ACNI3K_01690 [Demequina sp. SO4-13]|uniref:hypothetical protein n=1 Tax=Demequina sp. SO4-13 TaxID=3401027 RepID=UPI003AF7B5BA